MLNVVKNYVSWIPTKWTKFRSRLGLPRGALALALVPVLLYLPAILEPLPMQYYGGRETAFYFISLSIVELNVRSWLVLTIYESWSSPHLYSFVSAPFVAVGFVEGGRLVSLLATVAGALAIGYVTARFTDTRGGLVAIGLYWLHPFVVRQSYVYQPEAMSMALTTGTIAVLVAYVRSEFDRRGLFVLLGLLFVAPQTHTWEASIGLPVVVYLAVHGRYREGVLAAGAAAAGVVASNLIVQLQPGGQSQLAGVSVLATGVDIFLNPSWWLLPPGEARGPVAVAMTITLVVAVVVTPVLGLNAVRRRDSRALLLGSWVLSGLVIVFLIPRGLVRHVYYAWAIVPPMIVIASVVLTDALDRIDVSTLRDERVLAVVFALLIGVYGVGFTYNAAGGLDSPVTLTDSWGIHEDEAKQAGLALRRAGVSGPDEIAFVGDWGFNASTGLISTPGTVVLVYSGVLLDYRTAKVAVQKGDPLPEFAPNRSAVRNATYCVLRHANGSASIERC